MLVVFVYTTIFRKKMGETIRGKEKQDDQLCTTLPDYVLQNTTKLNKLMLPIKYWKVIVHLHMLPPSYYGTDNEKNWNENSTLPFLSVYSVYWFKKEKVDVKKVYYA